VALVTKKENFIVQNCVFKNLFLNALFAENPSKKDGIIRKVIFVLRNAIKQYFRNAQFAANP